MAFTSISFLAFLALVTLVYYVLPKRFQWCVLLVASYGFYLFSGIPQIAFLIGSTVVNFFAARAMQKKRDAFRARTDLTKEQRREAKKAVNRQIHRVQIWAVVLNILVLGIVKYLNFVIGSVNTAFSLFKFDASIPLVNMIVPLGISFYTFSSIGYLIDVGLGKCVAEDNIARFGLYVSFFPCIIQGPINRYGDLGHQLKQEHPFSYENLTMGAQLIVWGFFKKLVIADRVSAVASTVFVPEVDNFTGTVHFIGMLAYALQIYCDFSGGIDIARGAAQIMGIDLPQNFERPYFSTSLSDYWRRWHITLGSWMRDYVFYPVMLSGFVTKAGKVARSRFGSHAAKVVPSAITSFIVFFLVGIWHGANWHYVAFGLYNAILVAGGVALGPLFETLTKKLHIRTDVFSWRLFQMVRTFLIACIGKVIAHSWSLMTALKTLKKMATEFTPWVFTDGTLFKLGLNQFEMFVLFVATIILMSVSILQEKGVRLRRTLARQNIVFRWLVYLTAVYVVIVFGVYGRGYDARDFIYAGF
ncbi:MAG: MBOAT family protein [Clostridia bacterium]|nr:MBOAT family protein [Clostridia bacterium]